LSRILRETADLASIAHLVALLIRRWGPLAHSPTWPPCLEAARSLDDMANVLASRGSGPAGGDRYRQDPCSAAAAAVRMVREWARDQDPDSPGHGADADARPGVGGDRVAGDRGHGRSAELSRAFVESAVLAPIWQLAGLAAEILEEEFKEGGPGHGRLLRGS
jgi:hypothetical protein